MVIHSECSPPFFPFIQTLSLFHMVYIWRGVVSSVAHSINYIHEIYFHQIAFKRLILMLLLNVQPSVKHHRFNRQIRSFIQFKAKPAERLCMCTSNERTNKQTNESNVLFRCWLLASLPAWCSVEKWRRACFIFVIFLGWKSIKAMLFATVVHVRST